MLCTRHTGCHLICSCTSHLWHFFLSLLCCLPKAFPVTGTSRSACLLPLCPCVCHQPLRSVPELAAGFPSSPISLLAVTRTHRDRRKTTAPAKLGVQMFARHLYVTSISSQAGYHRRMNNTDAAALRASQAETDSRHPRQTPQ